ncbi:aminodeoxychorismate synthase component I [Ignavibacteriales bacterium]
MILNSGKCVKPDSLISLLQSVEEEAYSAILINPPNVSNKASVVLREPDDIFYLKRDNVKEFFDKIERLKKAGFHLLTLIDYEAGYLFSNKFNEILEQTGLEEFGIAIAYPEDQVEYYDLRGVNRGILQEKKNRISHYRHDSEVEYVSKVKAVKEKIRSGDTYQINLTMDYSFELMGSVTAFFSTLLFNQSTQYSAYINLPTKNILSLSPELFFKVKGDTISVAPMKGTAKLPANPADINTIKKIFVNDPKERAENLMIVDLLRNDLHKLGVEGPLGMVSKCKAERYETVFQMISEIEGKLKGDVTLFQMFEALYPCGSITGAPKISSMEIIRSLENRRRGIYTGSIGYLYKDEMTFNIAIRTLEIDKDTNKGHAGLGSGIVWDSVPEKEYAECVLKGRFFVTPVLEYQLFETMLLNNSEIPFLKYHLSRLKKSAKLNLFRYDEKEILKELKNAVSGDFIKGEYRLKLLLWKYGKVEVRIGKLTPLPDKINVAISKSKISTDNRYLYFKSTHRQLYDSERALTIKDGLFDLIYLNERGEVCEGGITNVFIRKGDVYYTPSAECGLLQGVGRKLFMEKNECTEKILYPEDLAEADEIILTNSLRGPVKVDNFMVQFKHGFQDGDN